MRSLLIILLLFPVIAVAAVLTGNPGSQGFKIDRSVSGTFPLVSFYTHYWDRYPLWGNACQTRFQMQCLDPQYVRGESAYAPRIGTNVTMMIRVRYDSKTEKHGMIANGPQGGRRFKLSTQGPRADSGSHTRIYRLELHAPYGIDDLIEDVGGNCGEIRRMSGSTRWIHKYLISEGDAPAGGGCELYLNYFGGRDLAVKVFPHAVSFRYEADILNYIPASGREVNIVSDIWNDQIDVLVTTAGQENWERIIGVTGVQYHPTIHIEGGMTVEFEDPQRNYTMTFLPGDIASKIRLNAKLNTNSDYVTMRIGNCDWFVDERCGLKNKNGDVWKLRTTIGPYSNPSLRRQLYTTAPGVKLVRGGPDGFFELNSDSRFWFELDLWFYDIAHLDPDSLRDRFTGSVSLIVESSF
jgi:hypothetical protein